MSELISLQRRNEEFRRQLLATVSVATLVLGVCQSAETKASEDADHPTVWIELGGQMQHITGQGDAFSPGFLAANPNSPVLQPTTPLQAQKPVPFVFGEEGKITIQPEDSRWVFTAAASYGRSSNFTRVDHQTNSTHHAGYKYGVATNPQIITVADFAETQVRSQESHAVLDFSAGKDVGLGMFGREGSSILSLGVRFAQFSAKSTFDVRARPDFKVVSYSFPTFHFTLLGSQFHNYHATGLSSRSFHGLGPTLSWNGSAPIEGEAQSGEINLDWGANASILFGKQKTNVQHHESARYQGGRYGFEGHPLRSVYQHSASRLAPSGP